MRDADKIRMYGREVYVTPSRRRGEKRFSIRAGDVVRDLHMSGRTPAVCSALKSREFLQQNNLQLIEKTGPNSGMSTTVIYTYQFIDEKRSAKEDSWARMRGALKDVFAELGGGERYLRGERDDFHGPRQSK